MNPSFSENKLNSKNNPLFDDSQQRKRKRFDNGNQNFQRKFNKSDDSITYERNNQSNNNIKQDYNNDFIKDSKNESQVQYQNISKNNSKTEFINVLDSKDSKDVIRFIYNPNRHFTFSRQRKLLPIFEYKLPFLYLVKTKRIVIVTGVTGSGKSTQIPQYLFENGFCSHQWNVCCALPRRISAISIAERVAQEMGSQIGELVGYHVPLDLKGNDSTTKIWYMTDEILIREMMNDPLLCKYSVIIIDEIHERTVSTDLLLGLMCKVLKKRNDLRLIICSATLDVENIRNFFEQASKSNDSTFNRSFNLINNPSLTSSNPITSFNRTEISNTNKEFDSTFKHAGDLTGVLSIQRPHHEQVEIYYTKEPVENYIIAALKLFLEIHVKAPIHESVLIFFPTSDNIENFIELVERENINQSIWALPLHGSLTFRQQQTIFENPPENMRKVIVSTSIAESALTIPSIQYVIDSGFTMLRYYDPIEDRQCYSIDTISKASAIQRAGRAGRDNKNQKLNENTIYSHANVGKCFRLYTQKDYDKLPEKTIPEILRSDLTLFILQLKAIGVDNIVKFNFLSPPPSALLIRALEKLYALGTLDDYAKLVYPLGYHLVEFPIDPRLSKLLFQGVKLGCTKEMLTISAILSSPSMFLNVKISSEKFNKIKEKFTVAEGDPISYLNIYNSFIKQNNQMKWCQDHCLNFNVLNQIMRLRNDLEHHLRSIRISITSTDEVSILQKCIISGLFENAAQRTEDGKSYSLIKLGSNSTGELLIHPQSYLYKFPPPYVVFFEALYTHQVYMQCVMRVEPEWLEEMAPHYYQFRDSAKYRTLVEKGNYSVLE